MVDYSSGHAVSVRVRLVTAALIAAVGGAASTARADLVGSWQFQGNLLDSSNYGNNAGDSNWPYLYFASDQLGNANSALAGGSNGIYVPDSPSLNLMNAPGLTVSAWVYISGTESPHGVSYDHGGIIANEAWWYGQGGEFAFQLAEVSPTSFAPVLTVGSPGNSVQAALPVPATSGWMNVAASFDVQSRVATVYVNGQVAASSVLSGVTQIGNSSHGLSLGHDSGFSQSGFGTDGNPLMGPFTNVQLYNTALPATGVLSNYVAKVPTPPTPTPAPTGGKTYAIVIGSAAPINPSVLLSNQLRGDTDAANMQQELFWCANTPSTKIYHWNDNLFGQTVTTASINTYITTAIASFHLNPDDSLIFYYSGHGGDNSNGVTKSYYIEPVNGVDYNASDLALALLNNGDPNLAKVHKTVILDSCNSGGFWDNGGVLGLSQVPNVSLLAAAGPDQLADCWHSDGTGLLTDAILDTDAFSSANSFATALNSIQYEVSSLTTTNQLVQFDPKDAGSGTATEFGTPFSNYSADYDPNQMFGAAPVPEPASFGLFIVGVLPILVRRRFFARVD